MKRLPTTFIFIPLFLGCTEKETEAEVTSVSYIAKSSSFYLSNTCSGEGFETPDSSFMNQTITLSSDGKMEMFTGAHCDLISIETPQECIENGECDCDFTYTVEECETAECTWSLYEWTEDETITVGYTQEESIIVISGSAQTDIYDDITITLSGNTLTWIMILDDSCIEMIYEAIE